MISNVKYKPTGRNLAEGETFVIKECKGRRIGFIGIVEYEWMATLATVEEKVRMDKKKENVAFPRANAILPPPT